MLTGIHAALFRALIPSAERDEVLADLGVEFESRLAAHGRVAARVWLWRQLLGSLPALIRRSWWRGWTGFEPRANRFRPGGLVAESWIMDLRYSVRRLARRPTYTALAVLTLALGAGGTAAIFSVARALLLDPLPIARESDVVVWWMPGDWNEAEFLHLRPDAPGFERIAAYRPMDSTLELPGQPLRLVKGIGTSAELFDVLGAGAFLGRTFRPGDDLPGSDPAAVISHGLWRELGADPGLVGRRLNLGGVSRTIVGVMPPGFWFPSPTIRVWTTMPLSPENTSGNYAIVGRMAGAGGLARMDAPLASIAASLRSFREYPPQWDKTRAPSVTPVREHLVGDVRPGVLATFAAMGVILLIACVNVAALMLGQVGGRSTELAVRTALGAGRQRLMQQLVLESLAIGVLSGAVGASLAAGGFQVLVRSLPLGALGDTATLDWRVFWAAISIALAASAAIAAVPGMVLWRGNLQGSIAGARSGGISARGGRLEGGLVVAQIALAVLLAAGAGLLIRTVGNLHAIDPGLAPDRVAVIDATMPTDLSHDERRRVVLDALPSLQALPHARAAAAMKLPLRGAGQDWGIDVEGRPDLDGTTTYFRIVSHDYFQALGIEVRRGRGFDSTDRANTERVVVINEALAAKYFPGQDPIGRVVHTGFDDRGERIIGVVENVPEAYLTDGPVAARYMLYDQVPVMWHEVSFVLSGRSASDVAVLLQAGRSALQRDAPKLAVQQTTSMRSIFEEAVGPAGRLVTLLSLLAALALVLGAVGVYGMISHYVSRRTREYGIRIAMGLAPARVVSQVLGRGLRLVGAGAVLGVVAAVLLTRLLASLLYGVSASDPQALAGAVATLLLVGSAAALIPARRASRTDPAVVLREQ